MSILNKIIKSKKVVEIKPLNLSDEELKIYNFFDKSTKISNANIGLVILITKDNTYIEIADNEISHKNICKYLLTNIEGNEPDLDNYIGPDGNKDYGNSISKEHGIVYFRLVSIINNSSILYYPDNLNNYQLDKISMVNKVIKLYNDSHDIKINILYNGANEDKSDNLDDLLNKLENKKRNSR